MAVALGGKKVNKILVYPYFKEILAIIKNLDENNYYIDSIVTHRGWGNEGEKIELQSGRKIKIGIKIEDSIIECNTVWTLIPQHIHNYTKEIENIVKFCILRKKNLYLLNQLDEKDYETYKQLFNKQSLQFFSYKTTKIDMLNKTLSLKTFFDYTIDVPIITVFNMDIGDSHYDFQKELQSYFARREYKVSLLTSAYYGKLAGDHIIEAGDSMDIVYSIDSLRRQIYNIQKDNNPDLIIIGISGPIMSIDESVSCDYGVNSYIVAQAIKSDYTVLNIYADVYNSSYFEKLELLMKYRFGAELDMVNMSNVKIDWNQISDPTERSIKIRDTDVFNKIFQGNDNQQDLLLVSNYIQDIEWIGNLIENKLSSYGEIKVF